MYTCKGWLCEYVMSRVSFSKSIKKTCFVSLRCMSIPVAMKMLYSRLQEITSAPLSPGRPATTEAQNDHSGSSNAAATDANSDSATFSQSAAVSEDGLDGSARCAASKSELHPETNTSPPDDPHPLPPVGVFPHCAGSSVQLSEPM